MVIRIVSMALGLLFSTIWVAFGFWAALFVGLLTLVGWGIGTMIEKRISVTEAWTNLQERWHY